MKKILTILCTLAFIAADAMAQSGVYVGGHIRRERPNTITRLKDSGFQYVILFNVDVAEDGTLTTDGETICKNGEYVFAQTQPHYVEDVKELKTWPTGIERIEICIGGWGNQSYFRIKDLIASQGTGEDGILYRNFKALKDAIPEIDAVNNDDEHCYDINSARQFHIMMYDLGYKTSLAPYTNKSFWSSLVTGINRKREGACDRIMVQCYDGGAYNNPSDWHIGSNVPLHGGRMYYQDTWDVDYHIEKFQEWYDNCNVTGGFVWVYNDESWDLHKWATGINRVYKTKQCEAEGPVTLYSGADWSGDAYPLQVGRYCIGELSHYGIAKGTVSSIKVAEGYQVTLYSRSDGTGRSATYTEDQKKLTTAWHNNMVALEIEPVAGSVDSMQQASPETELIYDLTGRCLGKDVPSQPGIYIKGGKKFVVKH